MHEDPAADIAFLRPVAEEQPIDAGEEIVAAPAADAFRAEGCGVLARQRDALRRARVGREEVEALVLVRVGGGELAVGGHRLQEPRRGIGVVAGLAEHVDADGVGLQFLLAREGGDLELALGEGGVARQLVGEHLGDDPVVDALRFLEALPLDAVIGGHVPHLVGDDGCDFRSVVGQRQKAAGDVDVSARQCEGVDRRRIEDRDAVGLVRDFPKPPSASRRCAQPACRSSRRDTPRHRWRECADVHGLRAWPCGSFFWT